MIEDLKNVEKLTELFSKKFNTVDPIIMIQSCIDNMIYGLTPPVHRAALQGLNVSYLLMDPSALEALILTQRSAVEQFLINNMHVKEHDMYDVLKSRYEELNFLINKLDIGIDPIELIPSFMDLKQRSDMVMLQLKPVAVGFGNGQLIADNIGEVKTFHIYVPSFLEGLTPTPGINFGKYQGVDIRTAMISLISEKTPAEQLNFHNVGDDTWSYRGCRIHFYETL